jgi:hypothetical protein
MRVLHVRVRRRLGIEVIVEAAPLSPVRAIVRSLRVKPELLHRRRIGVVVHRSDSESEPQMRRQELAIVGRHVCPVELDAHRRELCVDEVTISPCSGMPQHSTTLIG